MSVVSLHEAIADRELRAMLERTDEQLDAERWRYRIYAIWPTGEVKVWDQESAEQVGSALCTLSEEGEFDGDAAIGVLDRRGLPRGSGTWVVNPFTSARSRALD